MEIIVYYTSTAVLCTLGLDALFLLSPCCKWSLWYICMCWNDIYCICWCQTVSHTHAHIHSDTGRGKSSHIDAIFSLWSHLWACYSTKFNLGFCIKLWNLPHTSIPPVFFIILLTVVTSFISQKSVICCQNYYVVVSTNSSMKGFNYIIDQKTTKQNQKKNLGNICRLSVARFLFCLLLWHLFKIRALSCVRFH